MAAKITLADLQQAHEDLGRAWRQRVAGLGAPHPDYLESMPFDFMFACLAANDKHNANDKHKKG